MLNVSDALPRWDDPKIKAGTMVRTALWLVGEVGLGNVFTKDQLRHAFSGIAQADRRLRDLRSYGWVINTNSEDVSLNSNEQRLVAVGVHVWDPLARRSSSKAALTAKRRMSIMARADYRCSICGIAGGEEYPDEQFNHAVLSVASRKLLLVNGVSREILSTVCKRCRAGDLEKRDKAGALIARIEMLNDEDRNLILRLIDAAQDDPLRKAWDEYKELSLDAKLYTRGFLSTR